VGTDTLGCRCLVTHEQNTLEVPFQKVAESGGSKGAPPLIGWRERIKVQNKERLGPSLPLPFGKSFHVIPYRIIPESQVVRVGESEAELEGDGGTGWIQLQDNLIILNR